MLMSILARHAGTVVAVPGGTTRRVVVAVLAIVAVGLLLLAASEASAGPVVTIVLKDGTVIDGEIIQRTKTLLRLRTVHGVRKYRLNKIDQVITPGSDPSGLDGGFSELPGEAQQILDARALYAMGRYPEVIERMTPLLNPKSNKSNQMLIRWLLIEANQRLGRFGEATDHLEFVSENGEPRHKMRADAHLDIFKVNPRYDLRRIGDKQARWFLDDEMLVKGKEPGALADAEVMNVALEEYCDQILQGEEASVPALARSVNQLRTDTLRALDDPDRTGKAIDALRYMSQLRDAESSLYRVQAILFHYADAHEINLVRTEAELMLDVIEELFQRALATNPENTTPAIDQATGRLTPDGREEWRELCEEFLDQTKVTVDLTEYFLEKVGRYPDELRFLNQIFGERLERLTQMRQLAHKRKERSRA